MNRKRHRRAIQIAIDANIPFDRDFHALSWEQTSILVTIARTVGYRKPRNANGSTARYFYAYLNKQYN